MTCPELAQFLNALGVTNKNGRDHNGPVLWDTKTLRRKLGRARKAIVAKSLPSGVRFTTDVVQDGSPTQ
jgi:hypothetical protein